MRGGNGVEIAGEMQIDVFHRHHLRIAATGRATFHAEGWTEAWLAQAQHRLLADMVERVGQPHGCGGFALAGRRRRNGRHKNQFAVLLALQRLDVVHRDFGLVVAIGLEIFRRNAELFFCNIEDRDAFSRIAKFRCQISGFGAARRAWGLIQYAGYVTRRSKGLSISSPGLMPDIRSTERSARMSGWPG